MSYEAYILVSRAEVAELTVCGLSVIERNIRHLKNSGFSVSLVTPFYRESLHQLCQTLQIGYLELNEHEFDATQTGRYLKLTGDAYYRRGFLLDVAQKIKERPQLGHEFELTDGLGVPVEWVSSHGSLKHIYPKNSYRELRELFETHDEPRIAKWLSKDMFDELYEQTEGWVARGINKKISFPITRLLVKTPITPNQITVFCFILGLVGCFMVLSPSWLSRAFGAGLLQLSSILDGCDGEMAKLKARSSRLGAWLDTISDDVLNNALLICLYCGYLAQFPNIFLLKYSLLTTMASLGVSFFLYHYMITHKDPNAAHVRLAWEKDKSTSKNANTKSLIDLLKPLLKRDFFIFVLFLLIMFDLRLVALGLFSTAWIAFIIYFISFLVGLLKPKMEYSS